jgi:P-type Ca2+ transporter type 2B
VCRMLAIAYRDVFLPFQTDANRDEFSAAQLERELTLVALVGIEDPLREEVPAAIEACHRAGISVRMLTGAGAAHRQLPRIALFRGEVRLPPGCNSAKML